MPHKFTCHEVYHSTGRVPLPTGLYCITIGRFVDIWAEWQNIHKDYRPCLQKNPVLPQPIQKDPDLPRPIMCDVSIEGELDVSVCNTGVRSPSGSGSVTSSSDCTMAILDNICPLHDQLVFSNSTPSLLCMSSAHEPLRISHKI